MIGALLLCVPGTSPQQLPLVVSVSAAFLSWRTSLVLLAQEQVSCWPSPSSTSTLRSLSRSRVKWAAWARCYSRNPPSSNTYHRQMQPPQILTFYFALYLMRTNQYILPLGCIFFPSFFVFPVALEGSYADWISSGKERQHLSQCSAWNCTCSVPLFFLLIPLLSSLDLTSQDTLLTLISYRQVKSTKVWHDVVD